MDTSKRLETLIEQGLPVNQAFFHTAVNNSDRIPETDFKTDSPKLTKQVEMWITQLGLVCLHKQKYFIVPTANIIRME